MTIELTQGGHRGASIPEEMRAAGTYRLPRSINAALVEQFGGLFTGVSDDFSDGMVIDQNDDGTWRVAITDRWAAYWHAALTDTWTFDPASLRHWQDIEEEVPA